MSLKEEHDKRTQELVGKSLSFDETLNDLNNTSPLQMSKKLIEYELFDQQSSLEVMDKIYEEFENGDDVINSLVNPVFFNIVDGIVKHPKLGLSKTGLTASRLISEIKDFNYDSSHSSQRDMIQDKANLDENSVNNTVHHTDKNGNIQNSREYDRSIVEDKSKMNAYKKKYLDKRSKDEYTNENKVSDRKPQPDHIVPLEHAVKEYGTSKFLDDNELKIALNKDENFAVTNGSLNQSKGSKTNTNAVKEDKNTIASNQSDATKERMIQKEKEATKFVEKELNKNVANNLKDDLKGALKGDSKLVIDAKEQAINDSKHKAIGEIVILLIKPLYYEFSDIFKNGMIANFNVSDKVEAFIERMKRIKNYIFKNAVGTLFDNIKDFLQSFVTMLINGIINAFIGLLKKILKVISEGFTSIIEAIKIMMKPSEMMSMAQKADAITKLLATTVVTFLGAYFEESVLSFMNGTPVEFLKDVIMIMLTGIASTVLVWIIDQVDLFSLKIEKRSARVKEVFALRIENIKNNTDIFEKSSLEVLSKQKLQFKKITESLNEAIEKNLDLNDSIYQMADFMQIDLNIKTTDDFMDMLIKNKQLAI